MYFWINKIGTKLLKKTRKKLIKIGTKRTIELPEKRNTSKIGNNPLK